MTDLLKNFDGRIELAAIALSGRSVDAERGEISGVALRFGAMNRNRFAVASGGLTIPDSVPMLWAHVASELIGSWSNVRQIDNALHARGRLNLKVGKAREALALLKGRDATGLSVGLAVERDDIDRRDDGLLFRKARLEEISVVAIPADEGARVLAVAGVKSIREYERFLREAGFSKAEAKALASGGWPRLRGDQPNSQKLTALAARVCAATAELERG